MDPRSEMDDGVDPRSAGANAAMARIAELDSLRRLQVAVRSVKYRWILRWKRSPLHQRVLPKVQALVRGSISRGWRDGPKTMTGVSWSVRLQLEMLGILDRFVGEVKQMGIRRPQWTDQNLPVGSAMWNRILHLLTNDRTKPLPHSYERNTVPEYFRLAISRGESCMWANTNWDQYRRVERYYWEQMCSGSYPVVKWLWHGTSYDVVNDIMINGFQTLPGGVHAFGRGTYFTEQALQVAADGRHAKPCGDVFNTCVDILVDIINERFGVPQV